jgi:hypothetical protein
MNNLKTICEWNAYNLLACSAPALVKTETTQTPDVQNQVLHLGSVIVCE